MAFYSMGHATATWALELEAALRQAAKVRTSCRLFYVKERPKDTMLVDTSTREEE